MKTDVTGVLIIHNDSSLLEQTLSTVTNYIDRLLIVDGAYEWVAPFCELNNEDPEKSTDNMLDIIKRTGLPYEYYSGVWQNETHKRMFSLEKTKTNRIMRIDSDELFELDDNKLNQYFDSGKVFGECHVPLYFTNHVIGQSIGLNSSPIVPIFINKQFATVRQIVDSMFLLVPQDERTKRLGRDASFKEKLGIVHHVSSFRINRGSYRRARFYNLLSMRMAKKMGLINNEPFETDSEFFEKMSKLSPEEMAALDTIFEFHRINAAFPVIKEKQILVEAQAARQDIQPIIDETFQMMIDDQHLRLQQNAEKTITLFANRQLFFDVTRAVTSSPQSFRIFSSSLERLEIKIHYDQGLVRSELPLHVTSEAVGEWSATLPQLGAQDIRCILEIIPFGPKRINDFRYCFMDTRNPK